MKFTTASQKMNDKIDRSKNFFISFKFYFIKSEFQNFDFDFCSEYYNYDEKSKTYKRSKTDYYE